MPQHEPLVLDFDAPTGGHILTFEDNGRVAYAYLKSAGDRQIIGDVWVYNRCEAPTIPEWHSRGLLPFANALDYTTESQGLAAAVSQPDVLVDWDTNNNELVAYLYVFGELAAVVGVGDKPGYSRRARLDGPLARVFDTA